MKTTEELAMKAGAAQFFELPSDWDSGDYAISPLELETFRRLVIEDFIAGLEPVAWKLDLPGISKLDVCPHGGKWFPLYSLEGVKP